MTSFTTLLRRTAALVGAIAALTVPGIATSQTVTLSSGASCTYSQMTVSPSGNVVVSCGPGTGAGSFSLTAPTSLATSLTTTSEIRVNRASGTAGAIDVAFSILGSGCTAAGTTSPLTFPNGSSASIPIAVNTSASIGSCTVSITPQSPGTPGTPTTITISIVDPNAAVTFAFATGSSPANVGSGAVQVTVNRSGGTNGTWTVPVTLSGGLTTGGAMIAGAGSVSPASLTFAAGTSSQTVTYTPPSTTPATPALPADLVMLLGAPTGGVLGQAGTASSTPHTLTLNGPAVGCPAPTLAGVLGAAGNTTLTRMASGAIATYTLPAIPTTRYSGTFVLSETTTSHPADPYLMEIHINKCKGLVQPTVGDSCYISTTSRKALFDKLWITTFVGRLTTPALINAAGYCYAPPSQGPWYVNIRYTYPTCLSGGSCGWHAQWN